MKSPSACILPILLSAALAQSLAGQTKSHHPNDILTVVGMARGAPAEFSADVLLTIIEKGLIQDRREQRELLMEVFNIAGRAEERVGLQRLPDGAEPVSNAIHYVSLRHMDQVSLRARAVKAMLRLDPKLAREYLDRIEMPLDVPPRCEDPTVYDLSFYYTVMADVLNAIPGRENVEDSLRLHLSRMKSAAQIAPFSRVLLKLKNGPAEFPSIVNGFAGQLTALKQDSREFSAYFKDAIQGLAEFAAALPPATRGALIEQARIWVLQGVKQGLCGQRPMTVRNLDGTTAAFDRGDPTSIFNRDLAQLSPESSPPSIDPKRIETGPQGPALGKVTHSTEYNQFRKVESLLAQDAEQFQETERWSSEMEKYITEVSEWKEDSQNPELFYLEKCDRLAAVVRMKTYTASFSRSSAETIRQNMEKQREAPQARILGRERALVTLVGFFDSASGQRVYNKRRMLWFWPVRERLGSYDHSGQTMATAALYMASSNGVVNLYGRLATLLAQ